MLFAYFDEFFFFLLWDIPFFILQVFLSTHNKGDENL